MANMDDLLTTVEAARLLGVSRCTILNWIKKGIFGDDLSCQNVSQGSGCGYRIRRSVVDEHVRALKIDEAEPEPVQMSIQKELEETKASIKSMKLALANLSFAVQFCQEEIAKIEKVLNK